MYYTDEMHCRVYAVWHVYRVATQCIIIYMYRDILYRWDACYSVCSVICTQCQWTGDVVSSIYADMWYSVWSLFINTELSFALCHYTGHVLSIIYWDTLHRSV